MALDEGTLRANEKIRRRKRVGARRAAWIKFAAGALTGLVMDSNPAYHAGREADDMLTELSKRDFAEGTSEESKQANDT